MVKTKKHDKTIVEKIFDYSLEEIMGERFGRYSKYIIQDRAIPDVRDGLKPVQRRILYSMFKERNTHDKNYRKSAKTVGDVIGNYHPHGDTSIYDAMVRMSQDWKMLHPYVDMHGNNGSIDGDSPAAYRYTEARLSKISNELLKDIDKNTVMFAPNFDDTILEPTVLPAKYPNLLVSGTTGISAGYATNIPSHNLEEIIDATIKRIDSPNCRLETIMDIVKGPDFATGAIIEGIAGIKEAYETGRGRVIVRSKTEFIEEKTKNNLIITEIPYEVNKANLVRKIDEIRIDKKIDGIIEVRDESDKQLRIVVELKKDMNKELILNYLLKNTDLQISYNFNMVSIVNRRPKLLGILEILDAYIAHKKEVVVRRTEFDLEHAKARYHIVEGLIKCLSILDEVIKTIRASKNKTNAKDNLVKEYNFSELQAEAIVMLQLYKLTNTDVVLLEEELDNLKKIIAGLESILNSEDILHQVMKEELKKVKKEYASPRRSEIKAEVTELKIDAEDLIAKEDVIVLVTKDGYIKRASLRSYQATDDEPTLKENDYIIGKYEANTIDTVLLFTSLGNFLYVPVHIIPDTKWKDLGKHISNVIKIDESEEIIFSTLVKDFNTNLEVILASSDGLIKKTALKDFAVSRYTKPVTCMKLKLNAKLVSVSIALHNDIFISTDSGYGLWFDKQEVPLVGLRTSGVKAINLKNDNLVAMTNFNSNEIEYISIVTDKGTAKRVKLTEFEKTSRARRGLMIIKEIKSNPYKVINTFTTETKSIIGLKTSEINEVKLTEFKVADRYSTGTSITKEYISQTFIKKGLEQAINNQTIDEENIVETKKISLKEIDERLMTIDDFIEEE